MQWLISLGKWNLQFMVGNFITILCNNVSVHLFYKNTEIKQTTPSVITL